MPQLYLHRFTHLHTAANRVHWTADTRHKAPNKPLLLLAVLDQFAQGSVTGDLIELTPELGELFAGYWSRVTLAPAAQAQVCRRIATATSPCPFSTCGPTASGIWSPGPARRRRWPP
jgi:hypothetical protein